MRTPHLLTLVLVLGVATLASPPRLTAQTQPAALRIVVIEGEGAVNIIQQKTAVAPVVEVRDRNDQPVAGAVVQFAIRNGRATFGGARALSVTTNAAGRAVAAGFTPTGSGAVQIGATAAFQGQSAAAVTIAQTNVMTAAQAAAASTATAGSGGGAGGGGGGGLSLTTVGLTAASVAGAVVAVKELTGKTYSARFSGILRSLSSNSPCIREERQNGEIQIELEENGGNLSGTASIDGSIMLAAVNCPPDPYISGGKDSFGLDRGSVSGNRDNLTMAANASNNYTDTDNAGGGVNSYDFILTARFDGSQITGVLTIVRHVTFQSRVGNFTNFTHGEVSYDLVLR